MNNNVKHLVANLLNATFVLIFLLFLAPVSRANEVNSISSSIEITPESVSALIQNNVPFILIDSDKPIPKELGTRLDINKIYYTLGISKANARKASQLDRQLTKSQSHVLVGTPLDWRHLNLPFGENVIPTTTVMVSPKSLSEAIKGGEDILIIDLRGTSNLKENKNNLFPGNSISLLPHQVKEESKSISKLRWTVLVDDGQGVANNIAEEMRNAGYVLVGVLNGGYPAWVAETNK